MKKLSLEDAINRSCEDFLPFWRQMSLYHLDEDANKFLKRKKEEWIESWIRNQFGSAFRFTKEMTKNGPLLSFDNRFTNHLRDSIWFYSPFSETSSRSEKEQELSFFGGIVLTLQVIKWTKDSSFCRVCWFWERRKKKDSSAPLFVLQRLSLDGGAYGGFILAETERDSETWASPFLDPLEPELMLGSETIQSPFEPYLQPMIIGCRFRKLSYEGNEIESFCSSPAKQMARFLIKLLLKKGEG